MSANRFYKDREGYDSVWLDPDDKEDFAIDWTRWLPSGATLSTVTATEEDGVTVSGLATTGNVSSFFLSGLGSSPATVTFQATFSNTGTRSHTIRVYEREH